MADTKNYGLKGVGNDVQLGKAGPRLNLSGSIIQARNAADGAFVIVRGLDPVGDTDLATKLYVDNVASGLDHKASVVCATTATTGTYSSTGGGSGNGQLTAVAATIDGVTLAQGDRVLIKDHSTAAANGIYEVQATTTTLDRASDFDSDSEVTAGAFTFVEEGTTNINTGWVLQGPDPLTCGGAGGSDLNWVLFSASGSVVAGDAILKSGDTLNLDFVNGGGLTAATAIAGADQIAFADATNSDAMQLRTMTNVLADLDIVTATADGIITRTAADTYASRTITASAVAGDEGISIVNGNGVSGNPTIGIDIVGQTNLTTDDVDDADELLIYHNIAGGTEGIGNYAITASKLKSYMNAGTSTTTISELDTSVAVSDSGTDGTITTTADGTVVVVTTDTETTFSHIVDFEVDSATTNADIPVITLSARSTGTPAAGIGPSIQFESETAAGAPGNLEIGGLLALEATDVTSTSEDFDFVFQLMSAGGAATEAARITSAGDVNATTGTFSSLTNNDVLVAGASGLIEDSAGALTFDGTTLDVTGNFRSSNLTNNDVLIAGTAGLIEDSAGALTFDGTTLTVTGAAAIDEITIDGDTISNNTADQPIIIRPNGTGSIILQNGSSEEILELNDTVSAVNGLAITAGATGNPAQITTGTGSEANIDIGFLTNGTGAISVVAGTGNYEDNVTADDDIPNKKYVDDAVTAAGVSGVLDTVTGTVDLTSATAQNIGAATGIPDGATIMSVMLDVTTASDAVTTVTVGDATNGAASYMAATENDPEILDIYIADGRLANSGADRQAQATVATAGTVGAATCIITFRRP